MNSMAEVHYTIRFEEEARRRAQQTKLEQGQWEWWMAAANAPRRSRGLSIRQAAVSVGDFLSGLRCQLESRFASQPAATAC